MTTSKLGLPEVIGSMAADVPLVVNNLAQAVDSKAGVAGGLALHDDVQTRATKDEVSTLNTSVLGKATKEEVNALSTAVSTKAEQAALDATTAQLADTVKKTEAGVLNLNVFDEPTRNILQGQTPGTINAVLGLKNVQKNNLADKIVNHEKTTFLQVGKNLYNPAEVTLDAILSSSGTETLNTGYITTGFIPITAGAGLYLSVNKGTPQTGYRIVLYDANYVKLETLSSYVNGTPIANANARYFKTSVTKTNANNFFQIEFGNAISLYEPFKVLFANHVKRGIGSNADVETYKTLMHSTDTRRISVNRESGVGRVTAIHEIDGETALKTTTIAYDASGNVSSFTQIANGTSVKSTIVRSNGVITGITKEVV